MGLAEQADSAFLTALFSTIDAILDRSMEDVLRTLPLAQSIKDALLEGKGKLAECLRATEGYLDGEWDAVTSFADKYNISPSYLINSCDNAMRWMRTVRRTTQQ
jgi:EAL and modified HD-GYP domain-containing signal transduction protein